MNRIFELNRDGIKELLKSEGMKKCIEGYADDTLSTLGDGYGKEAKVGSTRVAVRVFAKTPQAYNSNLKHNYILKAVFGK